MSLWLSVAYAGVNDKANAEKYLEISEKHIEDVPEWVYNEVESL